MTSVRLGALASAVVLLSACGGPTSSNDAGTGDAGTNTAKLYDRLGKEAGIRTVTKAFIGRVVKNPKINGFFLNSSLNASRLENCLVKQLGNATGGPEVYDCGSMKTVHAGMGISTNDFNDLAGDLVTELKAAGVAQADIDTIVGVLTPMKADIVEDADNNKTIYQRVGRKPAVNKVVTDFITNVLGNNQIKGFFAPTDGGKRLTTCLTRQVCGATGGFCKYGMEVDSPGAGIDEGVTKANPCKDMKTVHTGMKNPAGSASGMPITKSDFDALVAELVKSMTSNGVSSADQATIAGVLSPMCKDIVANGTGCP